MTDFNELIDLNNDIITTYNGKTLIIKRPYLYYGPITMQYLPYGGIQSVYDYKIIINCKNGFVASDYIIYDGIAMSSKQFILNNNNLVNTVLPN
ncbi:MAG: hypothetical protein IJZ77_06180 [Bacilli bacterium]|nr:hypothetical protein [Bacilli bacterium]